MLETVVEIMTTRRGVMKYWIYTIFAISCARAEIHEIREIKELENYLDHDQLVIYDLDHTLIHLVQTFGNDHWFQHRYESYKKSGLSKEEAIKKTLFEWESVQRLSEVKLVESYIKEQIAKLQAQNRHVMGLTTRGLGMVERSLDQLKTLGVHLEKTAPSAQDVYILNPWGTLYRDGVYFTAASHKGKGLFQLLESVGFQPKKILFVNDKKDHLEQIEEICLERKIPFTGLRYGFLDDVVSHVDHKMVTVQQQHFGKILADDVAKKIAQEGT